MGLYKISLKLNSSYITPWESDTIFGIFCWTLLETEGEEMLNLFLDEFENNDYPVVFSNGFIDDYFPKPFFLNLDTNTNLKANKKETLIKKIKHKKDKKIQWINLDDFNSIINGKQIDLKDEEDNIKRCTETVTHVQIDRSSLKASDGILFQTLEVFQKNNITIYAEVKDEWYTIFESVLKQMELKGYGKSSSIGKGSYDINYIEKWNKFDTPKNANGYIILSNYIPKSSESTNGFYQIFVKHPKLGSIYSLENAPFKKPITFIKPGSIFFDDKPKSLYGHLMKNVSYKYKNVVQCGCTLAVPAFFKKI